MEPNEGGHVFKNLLWQFQHISKKGKLRVSKISISQPSFIDERCSEVLPFMTTWKDIKGWYSAKYHCYVWYTPPLCNQICIASGINIGLPISCLKSMWMNGAPLMTANMAPPSAITSLQQQLHNNLRLLENISQTATSKDCPFGVHTIQYDLPPWYGYPPAQQSFSSTHWFHQHSTFKMTPSSQPRTSAKQGFRRYGQPWPGYEVSEDSYGVSQMFPPGQFPGTGPSSPGAPRVTPALPGNNPVI